MSSDMPPVLSMPMNKKQTTELLLQLETHSLVAAGKLIDSNGTFNQKQAWANIVARVSILGSNKTVEQIKSHWYRLKAKAKDYNAAKKLYYRQTGNRTGTNFQVDTELEWVLRIVGSSHKNGLNFGRELGFEKTKLMSGNHDTTEQHRDDIQSLHANPISNLQTEVLQKPISSCDVSSTAASRSSYGIVGKKSMMSGHDRIMTMVLPQPATLSVYADQGTQMRKPQSSYSSGIVIQSCQNVPYYSSNTFTPMPKSNSSCGQTTKIPIRIATKDYVTESFQIERKILPSNVQSSVFQKNAFQADGSLRDLITSESANETRVPLCPVNKNIPIAPEKTAFKIINRKINFSINNNAHLSDHINENSASVTTKPSGSTQSTKSQNVPLRLKQQKESKKLSRRFFSTLNKNIQHQSSQPQPSHFPHTATPLDSSNSNITPSMNKSLNYTRYTQSWSNQTNFQTMALSELSKNTQALNNLTKAISIYGGTLNHSKEKED